MIPPFPTANPTLTLCTQGAKCGRWVHIGLTLLAVDLPKSQAKTINLLIYEVYRVVSNLVGNIFCYNYISNRLSYGVVD